MKKITLYTWSAFWEDKEVFIRHLKSEKNTEFRIFGPEEFWLGNTGVWTHEYWGRIELILAANHNTLDILIGTTDYGMMPLSPKVKVHCWPTFWFTHTLLKCVKLPRGSYTEGGIKYPYVHMVNRPRQHRCAMMDELARLDLVSKGAISWNQMDADFQTSWPYKWKFWKEEILRVDNFYSVNSDQYTIAEAYNQSFIDLVSETTHDRIFITEKTVKPLLYKKPFIVNTVAHYHRYLESLGFKLYNEIIDYSFDDEEDFATRVRMIATEIERISNIGNFDLLMTKIQDKIEYNYLKTYSIAYDRRLMPSILFDDLNRYTYDIPAPT